MPEVRRYLFDDQIVDRPLVDEIVARSTADFASLGYGICVLHPLGGDELVGFCGLRRFEDPDARELQPELLYGLAPRHWHRGYAREASVAMLRLAFERCGLAVVHAGIAPPNTRSRRVLEALGMRDWRRIEVQGQPADYARLAREHFDARDAPWRLQG